MFLRGRHEPVDQADRFIREFFLINSNGFTISPDDIKYALKAIGSGNYEQSDGNDDKKSGKALSLKDFFYSNIPVSSKNKFIVPRSKVQKKYIDAIKKHDMVIGIGPAGTGKTYLAMAVAISDLLKKQVSRIILARPAVEAGERLGFLPGDLYEKVNPYLRPLYDALYDMMDADKANGLIEKGVIEIAPLAFMRGRTLNDSFIILDEAQNTTSEQMKMYLTRLGFNSKTVITGDTTQVDLPPDKKSGLVEIENILKKIRDISFVYFTEKDVVRHRLVQKIIKAYEDFDKSRNNKS